MTQLPYQTILDESAEAILVVQDEEIVYTNGRLQTVTGYAESDLIGAPPTTVLAVDSAGEESPMTAVRSADNGGNISLTTATGEHRSIELSHNTVEFDGAPATVLYCRPADSAADGATAQTLLEATIDALPYPFYVLEVDDYSVVHANSRAAVEAGDTCYELTHGRDRPCDEGEDTDPCPISEIQKTEQPVTVEHVHRDEDGTDRTYRVYAAPIFDDDGSLVRIAESTIDITERVEYERMIKTQRDNLKLLNQMVRHDIRNDLQVVSAYTETLAERTDVDGHISKILEATHDAVEITKTARDVTQVMLQSETDPEPIGLRSVLEAEIDEVRSSYSEAALTVDGTIPDVRVRGDDLLESVFRNLLSNAIQHNDKPVPEVNVSVAGTDEQTEIRIADNGPGIPDDRKEDIFEEGEQGLDSSGTGLGLYLVETLVRRYGGSVTVEDNDPEGSVFVVTLPTV